MFNKLTGKGNKVIKILAIVFVIALITYLCVFYKKKIVDNFASVDELTEKTGLTVDEIKDTVCNNPYEDIEGYTSFDYGANFKFEKVNPDDDDNKYYLHYSNLNNKVVSVDSDENFTLSAQIKGEITKSSVKTDKFRYYQVFERMEVLKRNSLSYSPKRFIFIINLGIERVYGLVFEHGFLSVRPLKDESQFNLSVLPVTNNVSNKLNDHYSGNIFTKFTGKVEELDSHVMDVKFNPLSLQSYKLNDDLQISNSQSVQQQQSQQSNDRTLADLTTTQFQEVIKAALGDLSQSSSVMNSPTTNPLMGTDKRLKVNLNLKTSDAGTDTFVDNSNNNQTNNLKQLINNFESQDNSMSNDNILSMIQNMNQIDDMPTIPGLSNNFDNVCNAKQNLNDLIPANLMSRCYGCSVSQDDTFFKAQ